MASRPSWIGELDTYQETESAPSWITELGEYKQEFIPQTLTDEPLKKPDKTYNNIPAYQEEYKQLHPKTKEHLKDFTVGNSPDGKPISINSENEYALYMMKNEDDATQSVSKFIPNEGQVLRDKFIKQDTKFRANENLELMVNNMMSGGDITIDDMDLVEKHTNGDENATQQLLYKNSLRPLDEIYSGQTDNGDVYHFPTPQEKQLASQRIKMAMDYMESIEIEEDSIGDEWERGLQGIIHHAGSALNSIPGTFKTMREQSWLYQAEKDIWELAETKAKEEGKEFKPGKYLINIEEQEKTDREWEEWWYDKSKIVHEWADTIIDAEPATGKYAKPVENFSELLDYRRLMQLAGENLPLVGAMALTALIPKVGPTLLKAIMATGTAGTLKERIYEWEKENPDEKLTDWQRDTVPLVVGGIVAKLEEFGLMTILNKLPAPVKGRVMGTLFKATTEMTTETLQEAVSTWSQLKDIEFAGIDVGPGYRELTKEDILGIKSAGITGLAVGAGPAFLTSGGKTVKEKNYSSSNDDAGSSVKLIETNSNYKIVVSNNKGIAVSESKMHRSKDKALAEYNIANGNIFSSLSNNNGNIIKDGKDIIDGEIILDETSSDYQLESDGGASKNDIYDSEINIFSKKYSDGKLLPARITNRNLHEAVLHNIEQNKLIDGIIKGIQGKLDSPLIQKDTKAYNQSHQDLQSILEVKGAVKRRLQYYNGKMSSESLLLNDDTKAYIKEFFPDIKPTGLATPKPEAKSDPKQTIKSILSGKNAEQNTGIVINSPALPMDSFRSVAKEIGVDTKTMPGRSKHDYAHAIRKKLAFDDGSNITELHAGFGLTKQTVQDIFNKIVNPGKFKFSNLPKVLQNEAEKKGITAENFVDLFSQITGKGKGSFTEVKGLDKKQNAFFNKVLNKGIKKWFSEKSKTYQIKFLNPEASNLLKYLTKEEVSELTPGKADNLVSVFNTLKKDGVVDDMPYVAMAGIVKKGWYKGSAKAIVDVFDAEDGYRFAALLAGMSPQTSVESNLKNALNLWVNWDKAGRPTNRESILDIMAESVEGEKGRASILEAWINNSLTSLQEKSIDKINISGPKVQSFFQNLIGNDLEVTSDAWMANYSGVKEGKVWLTDKLQGIDGGKKGGGYMAMSAAVRMSAKKLNSKEIFKKFGVSWKPAEVQETVWSWSKAALEARAFGTGDIPSMVKKGLIGEDIIAGTPDFASLLKLPEFKSILKGTKYEERINNLEETERAKIETGLSRKSKFLRTAAVRLEKVYRTRQAKTVTAKARSRIAYENINAWDSTGPYRRGTRYTRANKLGTDYVKHSPDEKFLANLKDIGMSSPDFYQLVGDNKAKVFLDAITKGKKSLGDFGASVDLPAVLPEGTQLFLTEEKMAGFIIKPNGDISAVFNSPLSPYRSISPSLLAIATQAGGRKLDAFNTNLTPIYTAAGFKPVAKVPFDPNFKPPGWRESVFQKWNNGQPDVYAYVYDPIWDRKIKVKEIKAFKDYDEMISYRDEILQSKINGIVEFHGGFGFTADTFKRIYNSFISSDAYTFESFPKFIRQQYENFGINGKNYKEEFKKVADNFEGMTGNKKALFKKSLKNIKNWYNKSGKEYTTTQENDPAYSDITEESSKQTKKDFGVPQEGFLSSLKETAKNLGEVLSDRALAVGPEVKRVLRGYVKDMEAGTDGDMMRVKGWLNKIKQMKKLNKDDYRRFHVAILARDKAQIDKYLNKYDAVNEFIEVEKLLADIHKRAKDVFGDKLGKIEKEEGKIGYYPRSVLELESLQNALSDYYKTNPKQRGVIDNAIRRFVYENKQKLIKVQSELNNLEATINKFLEDRTPKGIATLRKLKKRKAYLKTRESILSAKSNENTLSTEERAKIINGVIFKRKGSKGIIQSRRITSEDRALYKRIESFYLTPEDALINYIEKYNKGIAKQKLFGTAKNVVDAETLELDESAIFMLFENKLKGQDSYTPEQQKEIIEVFSSLLNVRSAKAWTTNVRMFGYLATMGNYISMLTQVSDVIMPLARSRSLQEATDVFKAMKKAAFDKSDIKMKDVWIENMANEYRGNPSRMIEITDWLFTTTKLKKVDRIGKEVLINSQIKKFQRLAKKYNKEINLSDNDKSTSVLDFKLKLEEVFPEAEIQQVIKELSNGDLTPNTLTLAYNIVLDHQPVAISEMPAAYVNNPDLRQFYQLKTWTIRILNTAISDVRTGFKRAEKLEQQGQKEAARKMRQNGMVRASTLLAVLALSGTGVDMLKDWVQGKNVDFKDSAIENLLRLIFLNNYMMKKPGIKQKVIEGVKGTLVPAPYSVGFDMADDLLYKSIGKYMFNLSGGYENIQDLKSDITSTRYIPWIGPFVYYGGSGKGRIRELTNEKKRLKDLSKERKLDRTGAKKLRFVNSELSKIKKARGKKGSRRRKGMSGMKGMSGIKGIGS